LREFETVPLATLDRHRVLQILVNLLHNAKYACDESCLLYTSHPDLRRRGSRRL